jgi:DNA-binding NtrC family response regulator
MGAVMKKQPATETVLARPVSLLSVSPAEEDHVSLEHILARPQWADYTDEKWMLQRAATLGAAMTALHESRIPILICERDLPGGTWIDLLERSSTLPAAPHLIVSSRLADERLWGEALNLGAYDVLAKPFEADEVIRIVSLAWLHWRELNVAAPARAIGCVA